jgi:alkanesulfonate monooxygenase SsuD/methylene tetrahydromethanopterin reductase-like flavin-dependent oxidoreductase (luciferase family)
VAGITFGLDVPAELAVGDPVTNARRAETLGFDFVSTNDHVLGPEPRYEGWTLLTWLAAGTTRIRIASRVIGVPYREPALLGKMAETLDRLSGARLILGLGAGSGESEFRAMGLPESTVGGRVRALEEAIHIIRGLWQQPILTYEGERYVAREAGIEPRPSRRIPIWLGTVGPRGLALVGRLADGWIPSLPYARPEHAPEMIGRILGAATEAGRDPADIARIYNVEIGFDVDADADAVVGSSDQITERLISFARMGFTGFNFKPVGPDRDGQVERIAREVIPAIREGM